MIQKKFQSSILVVVSILTVNALRKSSEEDSIFATHSSYTLPIQHSFGPGDQFSSRGSILFKSSKGATASFTREVQLNDNELGKLKKLVEEDGLYFIRSPTKIGGTFAQGGNEKNGTDYVSTFVKACYLHGSGLQETITVAIDYAGNVIGLSVVSPRSECPGVFGANKTATIFNSTVLVQQQEPGAVPDTQTFVMKLEQEKADAAAGKGKDNRSFLAKYWMYIIPVFLILMLSSQAEPPAEGGGSE